MLGVGVMGNEMEEFGGDLLVANVLWAGWLWLIVAYLVGIHE